MVEKFEYYDILTVLVPGVLLAVWIPFCFPGVLFLGNMPHYPDAFLVVVLTVLSVLLGHLLQALSSLLEPVLYFSWGGRPSDKALSSGLKGFLPKETAVRIKERLVAVAPSSGHGAFLFAMQKADSAEKTRTPRFNALYAYHRSLFFLLLVSLTLLFISGFAGRASLWPTSHLVMALLALTLSALLFWYRARQRAFYYVREVLLAADRILQGEQSKKERCNV